MTVSPSGTILMYMGTSAPTGWILLHGQTIPKTSEAYISGTYSNVENMLSSDSNNLYIPDMRNRFPMGSNGSNLNSKGGSNSISINQNNLPSHRHYYTGINFGGTGTRTSYVTSDKGEESTSFTTSAGTYSSYNIDATPPFQTVNFIMKL